LKKNGLVFHSSGEERNLTVQVSGWRKSWNKKFKTVSKREIR
jgi:hypothetical protein